MIFLSFSETSTVFFVSSALCFILLLVCSMFLCAIFSSFGCLNAQNVVIMLLNYLICSCNCVIIISNSFNLVSLNFSAYFFLSPVFKSIIGFAFTTSAQ